MAGSTTERSLDRASRRQLRRLLVSKRRRDDRRVNRVLARIGHTAFEDGRADVYGAAVLAGYLHAARTQGLDDFPALEGEYRVYERHRLAAALRGW